MSLTSSEAINAIQYDLFAYVQVAAATVALYDHALVLGREVDLIWKSPPSFVMLLYVMDRYLGDAVLLAGVYLQHRKKYVTMFYYILTTSHFINRCLRLFEFRAWGTVVYSWATQAIMQLRIYAMYHRSKKILSLLIVFFTVEVAAIFVIVLRAIGPNSALEVAVIDFPLQGKICTFSGVNGSFTYLFIPVVCFETVLFILAARVYYGSVRDTSALRAAGGPSDMTLFTRILARDSLFYFFVNLATCAVVMGLWQSLTARYANICVPLVMLLEILVGTRLIINFRERFSRNDRAAVVSGRYSTFIRDDLQMNALRITVSYEIETMVDGVNPKGEEC
ncbi:hypothetical protein ID866_6533 [Astraeus odoratus]|nr:hypothetical protein ID866_6533 [Astraeus odoratus]